MLTCEVAEDPWLARVLEYPAYKVVIDSKGTVAAQDSGVVEAALARYQSPGERSFFYSRIATGRVDLVRLLSQLGFYVVDTTLLFGRCPGSAGGAPIAGGIRVDLAQSKHHDDTRRIAATAFTWSRFHLDPGVKPEVANRIKERWIQSYLEGKRGEALLVAEIDGRAVGFLAVLVDQESATIDLIATDPAYQGRGVARALIESFDQRFGTQRRELKVGTQIANLPSIRLYSRSGFVIQHSAYVMHRHSPPSAPQRHSA